MKSTIQKIALGFCLAIAFSFLFPQKSLADVMCTYGRTCDAWYTSSGTSGSLSSPTHNQIFKPGDAIRAKGNYSVDFTIGWSSGSEKCWEVGITKLLPGAKCPPSSGYSYRVFPMRYYEKTMYQDLWGKVPTCYACHTPSWEYWTTLFAKCRFSIFVTNPNTSGRFLFGNIDSIPTKNGSKISCSFDQTFAFPDLLATNGWAPGDYNLMVYPQQYYYGLRIGEIRGCDEYDSSGQEICESNYGNFYEHIKFTVPYTCTGSIPSNATIHSGDTTGLSANTAYAHSTTNTSPKCQFYCNTGYGWDGSACVPPPIPDLKVNGLDSPVNVVSGNTFTLSWVGVANATSCTGTGAGWNGVKNIFGGSDTMQATTSSIYTLTCSGPGGGRSDSVTVNVTPKPDLKINGSDVPITVDNGSNMNFEWISIANNATSCTASGTGWSGSKSISGGNEPVVANTLGNHTYTLTCTGPGGTGTDSVAVNVVLPKYTLTVEKLGAAGSFSTVTGETGINCGTDCSEILDSGTLVTLTATAGTDAVFEGWSGGSCTGKKNCSFNIAKDKDVKARFVCMLGFDLIGNTCQGYTGKCSAQLTGSDCYEDNLKDKSNDNTFFCDKGYILGDDPVYAAGKWTWTCRGGLGNSSCNVSQCSRYKEVAP